MALTEHIFKEMRSYHLKKCTNVAVLLLFLFCFVFFLIVWGFLYSEWEKKGWIGNYDTV